MKGISQSAHSNSKKRKFILSILAILIYLVGMSGFLSNLMAQSHIPEGQFEMTKKMRAIHNSSVTTVDNDLNHYIDSNLRTRIQVYGPKGMFKFAYLFNSTAQISTYYLDDENKLHILFSKPMSKMIISNGVVESFENITNHDELLDAFTKRRALYEQSRKIEITRNKDVITISKEGISEHVKLESTLYPLGIEFWGLLMLIGTLGILWINRASFVALKRKYSTSSK